LNKFFVPKLFTLLKQGYSFRQFWSDSLAGVTVGIVALPLALAFAIASGVSPEKGIYTAIIGGFIVSFLGGSKVQIGGPTGAFIIIISGIVATYGISGLTIATFMAGIMIILIGIARLGSVIKFIPHSLIVGFTSGIALIILSTQGKDFFGLSMGSVPSGFVEKVNTYAQHFSSVNVYALGIAFFTVAITFITPRLKFRIPGSLISILLFTVIVLWFRLPVETIESRFGSISGAIPAPVVPEIHFQTIRELMLPAFTIALLGAIESLLSAVVADGIIGGNHRSNMELVAQGTANVFSSVFGGIPVTGAIARTVTNIKSGGRTPVAGIIHSITLLIIALFALQWAKYIPLACLAGILVVVAYNMSEWRSFISLLKTRSNDRIILLVTFLLTVIVDLTVAIEIGMILAAFLFMRQMARSSRVESIASQMTDIDSDDDPLATEKFSFPPGVRVYEINGPLFFGAASQFKETMKVIDEHPKILILRMRYVPFIDATGIRILREVLKDFLGMNTKVILSGVQPPLYEDLDKARIVFMVGKKNVCPDIKAALSRANEIIGPKTLK
jgi:SulP family sulfate permease